MGQVIHNLHSAVATCTLLKSVFGKDDDKIVLASGGFDPLHVGHTRYLKAASELGHTLIVAVNGDGFLMRKKGYVFMPLEERLEIIASIEGVDYVVPWDDGGQFVDGLIRQIMPDIFAKGGDRSDVQNIAPCERQACLDVGCFLMLSVGGSDKPQSSSALVNKLKERR
jgi:cytidyltransferase-like protein